MDRSSLGRAVLAADELLCDTRIAALLAELQATQPGWFKDQMDAAVRDADRTVATIAGMAAYGLGQHPFGGAPGWLRLSMLETLIGWVNGRGSTCMHTPHPDRPQPVFGAVYRPGLVACRACTHLFKLRKDSPQDRACDGCGHIASAGGAERIYPGLVHSGALCYLFGVCADCRYWRKQDGGRG